MKITFTGKSANKKEILTVVLLDKGTTRLMEFPNGRLELRFVIGKLSKITRRSLMLLPRKIVKKAREYNFRRIAMSFSTFNFPSLKNISDEELASLLAQNFEMANYEYSAFKSKLSNMARPLTEIIITDTSSAAKKGFKKGQIIGKAVNGCRELANTPGGDMTPLLLAKAAKQAVKGTGAHSRILKLPELKRLGMKALLGVSRGSREKPCFIILEYPGKKGKASGNKMRKPIVLVGKGVTFDTGGLNIKPSDAILGMHMDMSGGAAVIYAIAAAASLKLKQPVIGLIPAVENMPSGESYRPGDILHSMSGKTIEILNTDAEGRVIMADALTYAERYNPSLVVDVATLTGAALVALGQRASVFMTKEKKLQDMMMEIGEASGDLVWPLPLWDEYEDDIKGTFGDVANLPTTGKPHFGGSIAGGAFLYQFAKKYPWIHIDMAPRMTTIPSDNLATGAAGEPVRLLVKLLERNSR